MAVVEVMRRKPGDGADLLMKLNSVELLARMVEDHGRK